MDEKIQATIDELMEEKQITTLMDVRSKPTAWCNTFSGKNLEKVFDRQYSFMGDLLGGKKEIDERAIESLAILQKYARFLLLCAEKKPWECHRHYEIALRLLKYNVVVVHLMDGKEYPANQMDKDGRLALWVN